MATWRSEDVTAEHRLRLLLSEARRAGAQTILTLSRLGLSDVKSLVLETGPQGAILPEGFEERLYQQTEGLLFFVVEYVATFAGNVRSVDDTGWAIPSGVRNLLLWRLAGLSETGRQLLDTAAVVGRSFDFGILQQASGRGENEAVAGLEELISQGLVQELDGEVSSAYPAYDFAHEQLHTLTYEETSLARRRLLHRRVADAMAARSDRRSGPSAPASQIGAHYRMSGEDSRAAQYFELAGQQARALFANAEALRHFGIALEVGHPDPLSLHEAIGDLHTLLGDYGAALTSYETAAAICGPGVLWHIEHKLGTVHHRLGAWDLAGSYFEAAQDSYENEDTSPERARLYGDWSLNAHRQGDPQRTLGMALRAVEIAEAANDI